MIRERERGQAALVVVLASGIFLFGALGLAIDGATLYFHRQMAQGAADAAAVAAMMSIFQGTNTVGNSGYFDTSGPFNCIVGDTKIPCKYASYHGFGNNSNDTITVSFPSTAPSGIAPSSLSSTDSPNQVHVLVSRNVSITFMRMVGASATTTIQAKATAAIVNAKAPIPILVLHPNISNALYLNGSTQINICGGPSQSIQVNSISAFADNIQGNIHLDLAGPGTTPPDQNCQTTHGNGGNFGVFGGSTFDPGNISYGTRPGHYIQPSSPIADPLLGIGPPSKPTTLDPPPLAMTNTHGCNPSVDTKGCHLYAPGSYSNGIAVGPNDTALFAPGIYYMDNGYGFTTKSNGVMRMCSDCAASPDPNISNGMLVYNKYTDPSHIPTFSVGGGGSVILQGTPIDGAWGGMLFFQDHNSPQTTHILGGGGCLSLTGTVYTTNTVARTLASLGYSLFQTIEYHGNPCSSVYTKGEIITDVLTLKGTADLQMQLDPNAVLITRKVSLIQ